MQSQLGSVNWELRGFVCDFRRRDFLETNVCFVGKEGGGERGMVGY